MYYDEAPKEPTYPYCVFRFFDIDKDFTFDLNFESPSVQFDFYSNLSSADQCDDGVRYIRLLYDWCTLTVTGYLFLNMERNFIFPARKLQPENIWVGSVRYTLLLKEI